MMTLKRSGLIFLLGLTMLLPGCSTIPKNDTIYNVDKPFKIILQNQDKISEEYYDKFGKPRVVGWADYEKSELHVPYSYDRDINGKPLPDFCVLGHELWHLKPLGYKYHK